VRQASFSQIQAAPELLPASQSAPAGWPNPAAESKSPHAASGADAQTALFGVQGKGNRFVYVCDRSASMAVHQGRPLAAAKRELIGSLQQLRGTHQFQIIFYNETPEPMPLLRGGPPSLVMADERGKRQAEQFIGGIYSHGGTRPMAALAMALAMRPDVLFLLADANPPGLSPDDLLRLRRLNRGTAINTIEFGVGPSSGEYNFLRQLADEHGGQHAYINVTGLPRAVEPRGESISAALPLLPQPAVGRGLGAAP
jgi:hypothetical protein